MHPQELLQRLRPRCRPHVPQPPQLQPVRRPGGRWQPPLGGVPAGHAAQALAVRHGEHRAARAWAPQPGLAVDRSAMLRKELGKRPAAAHGRALPVPRCRSGGTHPRQDLRRVCGAGKVEWGPRQSQSLQWSKALAGEPKSKERPRAAARQGRDAALPAAGRRWAAGAAAGACHGRLQPSKLLQPGTCPGCAVSQLAPAGLALVCTPVRDMAGPRRRLSGGTSAAGEKPAPRAGG